MGMTTPTEPMRQEHRQIRSRLAAMRALADGIDEIPGAALTNELDGMVAFLDGGLIPHALAEEEILYPRVAEAMAPEQATATMSRDHLEILRLLDQLRHLTHRLREQPSKRLRRDLRRILYRLEAIGALHLDKEEEIYLPILDEVLTPESAAALFAALHHAEHGARRVS
jgi:iron-sulfur cluster repair protein YtfE (RIC family)